MLLTIDVGNTNLTIGLYEGEKLVSHWRLATDHNRMPDEYGLQLLGLLQNAGRTTGELTGIALASVVPPLTGRVIQACREYLRQEPLVVDTGVKTGVRIRYEHRHGRKTSRRRCPARNPRPEQSPHRGAGSALQPQSQRRWRRIRHPRLHHLSRQRLARHPAHPTGRLQSRRSAPQIRHRQQRQRDR